MRLCPLCNRSQPFPAPSGWILRRVGGALNHIKECSCHG